MPPASLRFLLLPFATTANAFPARFTRRSTHFRQSRTPNPPTHPPRTIITPLKDATAAIPAAHPTPPPTPTSFFGPTLFSGWALGCAGALPPCSPLDLVLCSNEGAPPPPPLPTGLYHLPPFFFNLLAALCIPLLCAPSFCFLSRSSPSTKKDLFLHTHACTQHPSALFRHTPLAAIARFAANQLGLANDCSTIERGVRAHGCVMRSDAVVREPLLRETQHREQHTTPSKDS